MLHIVKSFNYNCILTLVFAAISLSFFGISAQSAYADNLVATISLEPAYPWDVAVNPSTNMIYVTQNGGNEIFVIDGASNSLIGNVTVGSNDAWGIATMPPGSIATNPNTNKIYVTTRNDGVVVLNGESNIIVTKLLEGDTMRGVGVNPNTNKIYVGDFIRHTVSVIDGSTDTIISTIAASSIGDVADIAVNPVTNRIYVAIDHSNVVNVIDGETNTVIDLIPVASHSGSVAVNSDTNRIYVASAGTAFNDPKIFVIDGTTNTVISTITETYGDIGVNPYTNRIYIANPDNDRVDVLDGTTNTMIETISVEDGPMSLSVNPSESMIYVTNLLSRTVSVIEGSTSPLSAPQNLSASVISSSQIDLSWTVPQSDGDSPITGYKIERSLDDGSTWFTIVSDTGNTDTTYSDTGLESNTTYTYRVCAINEVGTSLPSNTASATTLATINVNSVDVLGNTLEGIWMQLASADGTIISEGFTPITFDVFQGEQYTVLANNYNQHIFLHWEDGSMDSSRNVIPTEDLTMTATYTITTVDQIVPSIGIP